MTESISQAPELSVQELQVLDQLSFCQGNENAVPVEELAKLTGIDDRVVQKIVKHLIEEHHYPIGSSTGKPNGYYWITTAAEQQRSEAQLEHRIISTARRLARLRKNTPAEVLGQMILTLNQEAL